LGFQTDNESYDKEPNLLYSTKKYGAPNQNLRGFKLRIQNPYFMNHFVNSCKIYLMACHSCLQTY